MEHFLELGAGPVAYGILFPTPGVTPAMSYGVLSTGPPDRSRGILNFLIATLRKQKETGRLNFNSTFI